MKETNSSLVILKTIFKFNKQMLLWELALVMNNKPPDLKNQEPKKDRNKIVHLNLLSDKDIHA